MPVAIRRWHGRRRRGRQREWARGGRRSARPDIVLVAIDGTGDVESALLEELPNVAERARALVLSADPDPGLHARAIELGALGLVMKTQSAQVLVKAIQKVYAGELWLDRAQMARVVKRLTRRRPEQEPEASRIASLTTRERQIVELVTEGLRNKDIGERLFISESTARNHLTSILDKLGLTDRFQLAVYAFRRGLVLCPPAAPLLAGPARMTSYSRCRAGKLSCDCVRRQSPVEHVDGRSGASENCSRCAGGAP